MYTNLNIKNSEHTFKYIVEYVDSQNIDYSVKYAMDGRSVYFYNDYNTNLIRNINNWNDWSDGMKSKLTNKYIPKQCRTSSVILYFPEYSIETYKPRADYAFDISLNIHGTKVSLGSYLINRSNSLACDGVKKFMNGNYYECQKFVIPNVSDIIYSIDWAPFRKYICRKNVSLDAWHNNYIWSGNLIWNNSVEYNNDVCSIILDLHPVEYINDSYIKRSDYSGCQSFINEYKCDDYLSLTVNHDLNNFNSGRHIINKIRINPVYKEGLRDYILETYNSTIDSITLETVILDKDNLWRKYKRQLPINYTEDDLIIDIFESIPNPDAGEMGEPTEYNLFFDNWDNWTYGCELYSILSIELSAGMTIMIKSNKIPLVPDLFKFFIKFQDDNNQYIDISDMNNNVLNIVNKTVNEIKAVNNNSDNKTYFINPVFFKSQELANIIIHPEVIENICINLDAYKSKVNLFQLQINNVIFNEIGRINNGVLFKVVGNKLPEKPNNGTYYILNEDNEMVTYGKYIFEY